MVYTTFMLRRHCAVVTGKWIPIHMFSKKNRLNNEGIKNELEII